MKAIHVFVGIFALALTVSGCSQMSASAGKVDFTAQLSGSEQVPPVTTAATGTVTFWLNSEGTELHYRLMVSGLNNVTMAHLHLAGAGKNGPPVAWLYPPAPPAKEITGPTNGVLSEGMITASDLAGPLEGKTIADLVTAIKEGNIYVNVHTQTNPDGEIRGQLQPP